MANITGIRVPFQFTTQGYPASDCDINLINDSVFTILSTIVGERVHQPTFGSFLMLIVFEPLNRATAFLAVSEVNRALALWEPRIVVNNVTFAYPQPSTLQVNVSWTLNRSITSLTTIPVIVNAGI
jgi:uncharacterized protein